MAILNKDGYTLIELIIIIVLIGILVGIGVQQYVSLQREAAEKAHQANIRILKSIGQLAITAWETPEEKIIWTKEHSEETINGWGEGWGAFLEEWPPVPAHSSAFSNGSEYNILIESSGFVEIQVN